MKATDIEDIYELSPLQQGMLFHALYEPESRLYFEQIVVPFEGFVNLRPFEEAWGAVVAAHPALRTSFHWQETEKPVQVVHRRAAVPVEVVDLSASDAPEREARTEALLAEDRRRSFDLERPPLLRVTLVRLSPASHRLLFSFHHLILDGWSLQHVFREFSEAYAALSAGRRPPARAARPYRDYIRWLQKQDLAAARRYWREALSGYDHGCRLDAGAASADGFDAFAEHAAELPAEATRRLREYCTRNRLTMNTLVQGAWALLLSRLTGADDVVFGVTVSGRPAELPDVETMVGLFINTVPLRVRVDQRATTSAWLQALQARQFEARRFDYTPLVQIGEWCGGAGAGPLFDTLLAFENYPVQAKGDGEAAAPATFIERTNYPLSAAVVPGERLQTRLLYNRAALAPEAVAAAGEQFNLILEGLSSGADRRIGELETLTESGMRLFASVNDTETAYPAAETVTSLWREQVAARPNAAAVESAGRALTYVELDVAASRLASALRARGVGLETPVGVLMNRSAEFIIAALGILKAGGAYVPLDTAYPTARLDRIVSDVGLRLILTGADAPTHTPGGGVRVLPVEELIGEGAAAGAGVECDPLNTAYVMYTSGSTGEPKGIAIPHRAVVRLVRDTNYIELREGERVGHMSNCAFDAATFEIWGALLNGATAAVIDRRAALSPRELAAELRERAVGVLFITTALFNRVVAENPGAFGSLRVLLFGGESVDAAAVRSVLEAGPPAALCHVYGPTETATFATWHRVTRVGPGETNVPIGTPISHSTAYVLDRALRPVPPGATGELYLGGDGLARGYHDRPGETAERFLPDPFRGRPGARMYRTGDRVRWRADGAVEFLGRLDRQVKLRGFRVELGEIERRLQEHGRVSQAVATLRRGADGLDSLVAYVVPGAGPADGLGQELREALRAHLPEYMQPAFICPLEALPLTANGKIDYAALPAPEAAYPESDAPFVGPRDETERKLASIWQQVLGLAQVGVNDVFFDIGGHSLRATQLVSRIRREFGVELQLRAVFERPTVAKLAELLREDAARAAPEIGRVLRDDSRRVRG